MEATTIYDQPDPRARVVSIERLVPWPKNPRKTIGDLEELAKAILDKGILQSLVVRPHPDGTERYEIVCGERRWRAAQTVGFDVLPVSVRDDLESDDDALEVAVVENIQRVDVHPLEEADGLAALRESGRSVEEIAARIGRSTAYVYRRLALTVLCDEARTALLEGAMTLGAAQILARLADPNRQRDAMRECIVPGDDPVEAREMRWAVERQSLRLADAKWALDDATLVDGVPACSSCPTRTGAQAQLFGEAEEDDHCTEPDCYAKKREAHTVQVIAISKKNGAKVLSDAEAKELYPQTYSSHSSYDLEKAGYYDLAHRVPVVGKPWAKVLGDREVPKTVVRDPHSGEVHELVRVKDVEKVLASDPRDGDPGSEPSDDGASPKSSKSKGTSKASTKKKTKEQIEADAHERAQQKILDELVSRVHARKLPILDALRFIAEDTLEIGRMVDAACRRGAERAKVDTYGGDAKKWLLTWIAGAKAEELVALILDLLLSERLPVSASEEPTLEQRVLDFVGIDWAAIEKDEIEKALATPGTCRRCGCTDALGCPEGCSWVDDEATLCSSCVEPAAKSTKASKKKSATKKASKKSTTKGAKKASKKKEP